MSRKIADLERRLGAPLLIRSARRLTLTEGGQRYLDGCRRILLDVDDLENAVAGAHGTPVGDIAVSAPIVFGRVHVLPVLTEFLGSFPAIRARLVLLDRMVNLIDEGIDAAIRFGELQSSSLVAKRFGEVRRVVCASPAHLDRRSGPSVPDDLTEHAIISFSDGPGAVRWGFRSRAGLLAVELRPKLVVNSAEAAIAAALAGLGVTRVLSYQVIFGDIVHVGGHFLPARLRAFIDFMHPRLRARLDGHG